MEILATIPMDIVPTRAIVTVKIPRTNGNTGSTLILDIISNGDVKPHPCSAICFAEPP
jgi:hypothetical protein